MSTLPRVWLKSHAYQNVTAIVVTSPPTKMEGCKPPSSKKNRGTQPQSRGDRLWHEGRIDQRGQFQQPHSVFEPFYHLARHR